MKRKTYYRIARIIETLVYLYVMYVGLWVVCHLVGEIFEKLGVGG